MNYTDENGSSYTPDNDVWVFGGTVCLFANDGGMKGKTWAATTVDYRHLGALKVVGGLLHHPE